MTGGICGREEKKKSYEECDDFVLRWLNKKVWFKKGMEFGRMRGSYIDIESRPHPPAT